MTSHPPSDPGARVGASPETLQRLVRATSHELGNQVAAVRLQAHLLQGDLGPKALANASIEIDDLAARMSALLALARPLVAPLETEAVPAAAILAAAERVAAGQGGRGTLLGADFDPGLPTIVVDADAVQNLLVTLVFGALEAARHRGEVRLLGAAVDGEVRLCVEDDAPEDAQLTEWRDAQLRGRVLACALADEIVGRLEGRVEVARTDGRTRIVLCLPAGPR